ncbi:hypothetical protein BACIH_0948 [Bacillus amyloliquefaciens]|nr:hypothetical protein U471_09790 [Bacillus amyloliquefaciens CC178]KYC87897.1 hypothetical protein B4140_1066 [Bacillus amyloliquefaciens]RAP15802.1 hypothetical protein HS9_01136 [Bacillus velezensis]QEY88708.1 hypothetical protein BACIT_0751 [Bacillus amyloliquefaciens]QEY92716.1 hypothetical protein BACIH_0948 [Bacillus amyloliquefaciens]
MPLIIINKVQTRRLCATAPFLSKCSENGSCMGVTPVFS